MEAGLLPGCITEEGGWLTLYLRRIVGLLAVYLRRLADLVNKAGLSDLWPGRCEPHNTAV